MHTLIEISDLELIGPAPGTFIRGTWDNDPNDGAWPEEHTLHILAFRETFVAPPGWSGGACWEGHLLPAQVEWLASSRKCQCGAIESSTNIGVISTDADLIREPNSILERVWWHASLRPPAEMISHQPGWTLHVGTKNAAQIRAQALLQEIMEKADEVEIFFYQFMVARSAGVAVNVFIDSPVDDPHHRLAHSAAGNGVARYINRREDTGSVSLIGNAGNFLKVEESSQMLTNPYSESALIRSLEARGINVSARDPRAS